MVGRLIVIEGTDGSGKKTQTELLVQRLRDEGRTVTTFSFPQYGKKSAGMVEEYLAGKYGPSNEVDPYSASVFYAVDRFDVAKEIRAALNRGEIVVLDRYVDSNAGHQGGKFRDPEARAKFLGWLYDFEYRILDIPEPNIVVLLYMPVDVALKLMEKRERAKDGHEADTQHLRNAEASYLWLAEQYPEDHQKIDCVQEGEVLPKEVIAEKVYKIVAPLLK